MPQEIKIDAKGDLYVDGKLITPKEANTVVADADAVWKAITNHKNWNIKQIEKGAAYVAGVLAATNVLGQIPLPTNLRVALPAALAFVVGMVHISTPKAP